MHSLLEDYLSEVAAQLGPLPVKRRNEELREMRAHLENAVIVSRELGQSEEEAAQNIVAQFGPAQDLRENIVWAWRREQMLNKRSLWGAAACTLVVMGLVPLLLLPIFVAYPFEPMGPVRWESVKWVFYSLQFGSPVLAGIMSGVLFTKRAIAGAAVGTALYCAGFAVLASGAMIHGGIVSNVSDYLGCVSQIIMRSVEVGLVTLLVAWVSSKWQRRRWARA